MNKVLKINATKARATFFELLEQVAKFNTVVLVTKKGLRHPIEIRSSDENKERTEHDQLDIVHYLAGSLKS